MKKGFKKLFFGTAVTIFSIPVFASDGAAAKSKNVSEKVEEVTFYDDAIVSGKQQAINRTNAVFNYNDNAVYEIYAKMNRLTTLRLQEGEKILFYAGGDTERWDIEESQGGKGNRPLVFIKPNLEDDNYEELSTNINIITDRHVYFLDIKLTNDRYNVLVEWQYPNERKIILEAQERNTTGIGTDDLTKLNYGYDWKKNVAISPVQVFDNGEHTFLVMKDSLKEMPAIFARDLDKNISLVTPKINGKYVVLDRLTNEIILQLGKTRLKIYNRKYNKTGG